MSTLRDRTLALAGIFQAASLVKEVANRGMADRHDVEMTLRTLFVTDPQDTDEVYGRVEYLRTGLQTLLDQLEGGNRRRDLDIARYVVSLLHLQRKLKRNRPMLARVAEGIERARRQSQHYAIDHPNVIANLADTYTETLSTLQPRIMVSGESQHLTHPDNANLIRALLLAGIRSAVLWDQLGGSRWQILLSRRRIVDEARRILEEEILRHPH